MSLYLSKIFTFESAHILSNYDGFCRNIHGHSYILTVTVSGDVKNIEGSSKEGMLMDFKDLKTIVKKTIIDTFDHSLIINRNYPKIQEILTIFENKKIILVEFEPTCENLIVHFAHLIKVLLPNDIKLQKIKLHETANSYIEWIED